MEEYLISHTITLVDYTLRLYITIEGVGVNRNPYGWQLRKYPHPFQQNRYMILDEKKREYDGINIAGNFGSDEYIHHLHKFVNGHLKGKRDGDKTKIQNS